MSGAPARKFLRQFCQRRQPRAFVSSVSFCEGSFNQPTSVAVGAGAGGEVGAEVGDAEGKPAKDEQGVDGREQDERGERLADAPCFNGSSNAQRMRYSL